MRGGGPSVYDMSTYAAPVKFDTHTLEQTTNAKGATIRLGDVVKAKGSKIERTVVGIATDGRTARGIRADNGRVTYSVWLDVDALTIVRAA